MMKRMMMALVAVLVASVGFSEPAITGVSALQQTLLKGKVNISYTAKGVEASAREHGSEVALKVIALDKVSGKAYTALSLTGDAALSDGTHTVVWDMLSEGMTLVSTEVVFSVSCETVAPLYSVLDLSDGSSAASYPVTSMATEPSEGWSDEFKTTKLVMRRIDPGMCAGVKVTAPYYIGVFEMTQKQYEQVTGSTPSYFSGNDKRPVEYVSYNVLRGTSMDVDETSVLGKLRARTGLLFDLPTGTQWEYACRAGTTTDYCCGDSDDGDYMWYFYNSSFSTHDVGTKMPNGWGLYDMHGNVWEWCLDADGTLRVLRGGGWGCMADRCKSSSQESDYPSYGSNSFGFRLVRALSENEAGKTLCSGEAPAVEIDLSKAEPEEPVDPPVPPPEEESPFRLTNEVSSVAGEALNSPNRVFTVSGHAAWMGETTITKDGVRAMHSGAIAYSERSILSTTVFGKGTVSFWWKASCDQDPTGKHAWDHAEFHADDMVYYLDGETDWLQLTHTFETAGSHTLEWVYMKDAAESVGDDCVYVDMFSWSPSKDGAPGFSYETAFTSIADYNDAVTNLNTSALYTDADTYLVVSNFNFLAGVDYSLARQKELKLHLFVYNCMFPSANGTMNPDGPNANVMLSNRKMIAVLALKELWVEGCTFNVYTNDNYVIDVNTVNTFENEGFGVTITNNTFEVGAGNRVPLSMKNKTGKPLAFMIVAGNTFKGTNDVAGVICFGDCTDSALTDSGADFPITVENNTFVNAKNYRVMTGTYQATGKESMLVLVDQPFTWARKGDAWVATPAFHTLTVEGLASSYTFDHTPTALEAGEVCPAQTGDWAALSAANWNLYTSVLSRKVTGNTVSFDGLVPSAQAAVDQAVVSAASAAVALKGEAGSVVLTTIPGLYYSVASGEKLGSLSGEPVMATGTELSIPVEKLSDTSGFYQIKVSTTK